jgi:hypothetical protein
MDLIPEYLSLGPIFPVFLQCANIPDPYLLELIPQCALTIFLIVNDERLEYLDHVLSPESTSYNFGIEVVTPNVSALILDQCSTMSLDYLQIQICERPLHFAHSNQ